jgi:hypothetical protein
MDMGIKKEFLKFIRKDLINLCDLCGLCEIYSLVAALPRCDLAKSFRIFNKLPRRKQQGIVRHAGLDPASSPVSGFRRPPE